MQNAIRKICKIDYAKVLNYFFNPNTKALSIILTLIEKALKLALINAMLMLRRQPYKRTKIDLI
jgi:hypothetical protein